MHRSDQEPSSSIAWMLHSAQVDDATLIEALSSEFYAGLYAFALELSGQPHRATVITQGSICKAVRDRHRFWNETTLRAWLYRLAYLQYQNNPASNKFTISGWIQAGLGFFLGKKALSSAGFSRPDQQSPSPILLRYGHSLEEDEITYVLGEDPAHLHSGLVRDQLKLFEAAYPSSLPPEGHARYIELSYPAQADSLTLSDQLELEQHLTNCSFCQEYRQLLPELEKTWRDHLKPATLPVKQVQAAVLEATTHFAGHDNGHPRLLPLKEISLVVILLFTLVAFGRSQGIFEAIDVRPTQTARPAATSIPTRTPAPTHTPAPHPIELNGYKGEDYFFYFTWTTQGDTWETIASKAGLRVELVRYLNPDLPELFSRSTRVNLVGLKSSAQFQFRPASPSIPTHPPLTSSSPIEEVLHRAMQSSRTWNTLFMDQALVSNGPPGYSGPLLHISRNQVYASQPHSWISIESEAGIRRKFVKYGVGEWVFMRTPDQGIFSAVWNPDGFQGNSSPLSSDFPAAEGIFQNAGEDIVAGRTAVILDRFNLDGWRQQRLWFDIYTGLVLKNEVYSGSPQEFVVQSMVVNKIYYDIPFPNDLFYPPNSGYLQFIGGSMDEDQFFSKNTAMLSPRPVPHEKINPPLEFDPAQYPLILNFPAGSSNNLTVSSESEYFEFSDELTWDGSGKDGNQIQVYAGPYYLGDLELESTTFRACQRSPDGMSVALLTSQDRSRGQLTWFNLSSLVIHDVTELAGDSKEFVFSPFGHKLAFANCRMSCGVSVLDLISGDVTSLGPVYDWVSYLEWSPNGDQVAFMTFRWPLNPRVHVVEVDSGLEIHVGEYDLESRQMITPGSPIESWQVSYPSQPIDRGCMLPNRSPAG
jgi:hypothetical protein